MSTPNRYIVGALFPRLSNGQPNVITNLKETTIGDSVTYAPYYERGGRASKARNLKAELNITTDSVKIRGVDRFIEEFYLPQISDKQQTASVFSTIFNSYAKNKNNSTWTTQARNRSMATLITIGYIGPGAENSVTDNSFWNANGTTTDPYWHEITNINNYKPEKLWSQYRGDIEVYSRYNIQALLENLDPNNENPDLWYPAFLYTYGQSSSGSSYPGPVFIVEPGSDIKIKFNNNLTIPGLTEQQAQQATLVPNSTYGNSASGGLGGATSVNFHLHGSHTNPAGFGDNVVARYTAGQTWTTEINIPADSGQGSYWYHPHYHPSVNQQVYGGLSGFMQIGDPLSKVPYFRDVPRNLAILKTMKLDIDRDSGDLLLGSIDSLGGVANRMTMVTVNGEFQPTASLETSGWQSLTLSNQTNQAFYNISLIHTDSEGKRSTLPLYIYGEDGHQYPQIRNVMSTLGNQNSGLGAPKAYMQAENLITVAPGKRLDLLVKLPKGSTEIASTYSFKNESGIDFKVQNMGGYPDLTSTNQGLSKGNSGAGALAFFQVSNGSEAESQALLDEEIKVANLGIQVQEITPTTRAEEYDLRKVPSVNLFDVDNNGVEIWRPNRKRSFSFAGSTLVGPAAEWDAPTQALLADYTAQNGGAVYQRYTELPIGSPGVSNWLGYEGPFLINDHVFPNSPLIISQIGTLEEWQLLNWSTNAPYKYIGHPFHIHINDYQVKDSDTELANKQNLEDVTMLNSSGYDYVDKTGTRFTKQPLKGTLISIPEALDPDQVSSLATWGANSQTVRMLFQDYLGTYVFHCHILPHEDAGMMQVLTVVDNTNSSWLLPSEGFRKDASGISLLRARDFKSYWLTPSKQGNSQWQRAQVGDISRDFIQDIIITSSAESRPGFVEVFDGATLQQGKTQQLSMLTPFPDCQLAPWAFAEDFSGDGQKDLVTIGYTKSSGQSINLHDLSLVAWESTGNGTGWIQKFRFDPFDSIHHHGLHGTHALDPVNNLQANQTSALVADINLDNFQDYIFGYAIEGGIRIVALDGAALTLTYQTGTLEGGYFPNQSILADALLFDSSLSGLTKVVLNAGFNSYAQSAIENLVVTTDSSAGLQNFTLQLNAGHFIATSTPDRQHWSDSSARHGGSITNDNRLINLTDYAMPMTLVDQLWLPHGIEALTPAIAATRGISASLAGNHLVIAQGNSVNGTPANNNTLINNSQQLVIPLEGLLEVNYDDLTGITTSQLNTVFSAEQLRERNQLTALTYQAYAGSSLWPSGQASLAALILGQGQTAAQLAQTLNTAPGYQQEIEHYYGGPLSTLAVSDIVTGATRSLYGREATNTELNRWQQEVEKGLSKTLVPLSILQASSGADLYRVGLLSAASQWNQVQWGTSANIAGSFGQGFQNDETLYDAMSNKLNAIQTLKSWDDAQSNFNDYTKTGITWMAGSPVSPSGFF